MRSVHRRKKKSANTDPRKKTERRTHHVATVAVESSYIFNAFMIKTLICFVASPASARYTLSQSMETLDLEFFVNGCHAFRDQVSETFPQPSTFHHSP